MRLILCRSSTPIAKNIGYYNDIEDSIVDGNVAHSKKEEKNKNRRIEAPYKRKTAK